MNSEFSKHVEGVRSRSFREASRVHRYYDQRGLFRREGAFGYNEILPRFRGERFCEIVERKVMEAGIERVHILDMGCGPWAICLQDCVNEWGDCITGYGINARIGINDRELCDVQENGLHLVCGDMQELGRYFEPESMDVVVACRSFPYLSDPFLTLVGVNSVLSEEGVALISDFPITALVEGLDGDQQRRERFVDYLRFGLGMEVNVYESSHRFQLSWEADLAFSKIPRMELPVRYSGRTTDVYLQLRNKEVYSFEALTYKLSRSI